MAQWLSRLRRLESATDLAHEPKEDVPLKVLSDWCAPDFVVFELGDTIFVGAYLCPVTSQWRRWSDIDPEDRLTNILAYVSLLSPPRNIVLLGDMNGRTGNLSPSALYPRTSQDSGGITRRGRWLVELASDYDLAILNGTRLEVSKPGRGTSFQIKKGVKRETTIDYALVSKSMAQQMSEGDMYVSRKIAWSDHAYISCTLPLKRPTVIVEEPSYEIPSVEEDEADAREAHPSWFQDWPELTEQARQAVAAAVEGEEALSWLYGMATADGQAVRYEVLSM